MDEIINYYIILVITPQEETLFRAYQNRWEADTDMSLRGEIVKEG